MICETCSSESGTTLDCGACGARLVIDGRYRLEVVIDQDGSCAIYGATRLEGTQPVMVTVVEVEALPGREAKTTFDEQARSVQRLSHPGVPKYVDHLVVVGSKSTQFCLVHELVEGADLATESREREHQEREVVQMLGELLEILAHSHQQTPTVVHGAINPRRVVRRRGDGRLILIGFGTDGAHGGERSAYWAPEQAPGETSAASDLYALGALAVFLLSRGDPQELLDRDHDRDWRSALDVQPPTARLLADLLEPDPTRRARSAADVLTLVPKVLEALADEDGWEWQGTTEPTAEEQSFQQGARAYRVAAMAGFVAAVLFWGVGFVRSMPWPMFVFGGTVVAFIIGLGTRIVMHPSSVNVADEGPGYSIQRDGRASDGWPLLGIGLVLGCGFLATGFFGDFGDGEADSGADEVAERVMASPGVTTRWPARVTAVEGKSLGLGAPCEVVARFKWIDSKLRAVVDIACEGQPLYVWTDPLEGVQRRSCNIWEGAADTRGGTYHHRLRCHDEGARTGSRPQMTIDTYAGSARVFHDAAPAFSVQLEVDEYSTPQAIEPIFEGNRAKDPGFDDTVVRQGRVTYSSGPAPATSDQACTVRVFPVPTVDFNCRVEVSCGEALIYGVEGGGFVQCSIQNRQPVLAQDPKGTVAEGDAMLDMNLDTRRVVVSDDAPGATWRVEVSLDGN